MDIDTLFRRRPFVFPLACVAALAFVVVSEGSYWQSVRTLDDLAAIQASRLSLLTLDRSLLDAESGQRGYLLTDRREYLAPYAQALREVETSFTQLERYYRDQPPQQLMLARLRALIDTKLSELSETIRMHEQGRLDAAVALVLSDIGKEKMEAIQVLSRELLDLEARHLAADRDDLYLTLMLSRVGMAALSTISLLALFMYLRQTSAFEKHQSDLKELLRAERDSLGIEVRQRTAQLTELTHHLQTAREDERHRLARNLHDELGALLTSAKLDAARIRSRLGGSAPEALERLTHLVETLNSSIALGRRIIEDLRPSTLGNLGLVATLEIAAREFARQSGIPVHCALAPVALSPEAELTVYRVVQECITNISKYARAREVWISLAEVDGQVRVEVRDDGVGFDSAVPQASAFGLLGMRFRVEAEGGTLAVEAVPGRGARVTVTLPPLATT